VVIETDSGNTLVRNQAVIIPIFDTNSGGVFKVPKYLKDSLFCTQYSSSTYLLL